MDRRHSVGSYELRSEDYIAFNRVTKKRFADSVFVGIWSALATLGFIFLFCLICGLVLSQFMSALEFRKYVPWLPMSIIGAAGFLFLWLYFYIYRPYVLSRLFHGQGLERRKRTVTISPTLIETETGAMKASMPWSEVHRVVVTDAHVFLFLSSMTAIIVPARAFASPQEAKSFGDDARAWHGAAKLV
jgi:hypothetical protein